MRLIDADKLAKLYKGWLPQLILPEDKKDKQAIETCIAVLEDAPTIDPESLRPQGEWEEKEDVNVVDVYYTCSVCKEDFVTIDGTPIDNLWNYCPHCGAKMKGAGDHA